LSVKTLFLWPQSASDGDPTQSAGRLFLHPDFALPPGFAPVTYEALDDFVQCILS
jgi:hypothetical protein